VEYQRPQIAVVVPTYRRADRLERLLGALAAQTIDPARWELVVVDNASHDPAVDQLTQRLTELVPCAAVALVIETNRGPAAARNRGWQATEAPVVAFVDDDVVPDPGWLEAGLAAFAEPAVGVVQGRTRLPDGVVSEALPPWSITREIDRPSPFFEACNIFYRRNVLTSTTGFDEAIGWIGEDTELGWQVVESGWQRSFAESASVVHDVEMRGPRWFLSNGWLEHHVIDVAAHHPGFRREAFWRPWAPRKRDAAFVAAAVSVALAVRWRPAALGVLPYLWWARPSLRQDQFLRRGLVTITADAARAAGHLAGAIRHGVFVI
jgi:GT2 family glycosyltransferase